jgi:cyclin-dependent kinase 8/11
MDNKKTVPFQANQMQKVMDIMGPPTREKWKGLVWMAEHSALQSLIYDGRDRKPIGLENWWKSTLDNAGYNSANEKIGHPGDLGLDLLKRLLEYDPEKRLTAREALVHPYFGGNGIVDDRDADASAEVEGEEGYGEEEGGGDRPFKNCFQGVEKEYPHRRVSNDDNDIRTSSLPGTKRAGLPDDSRPGKRIKE